MAQSSYERLSVQDRSFLVFEDASAHMHLGGLAIFEAGPLATPEGGIDIRRIRAHIAGRLHLVPRYRQRLAWVPVFGRPVWVDDDHFSLTYHVRHTALPRPGDDWQLKRLAARILSQQLDRGKPLWEIWVVEGLQSGQFALLVKTHHALADGISAFDLFAALVSPAPDDVIDEPLPWTPRRAPDSWQLFRDQLVFQTTAPVRFATNALRALADPRQLRQTAVVSARALYELASAGFTPPPATPLNRPISAHRRFDWATLDLGRVKVVKDRLGGTVNDVVLTNVAGAMRRFLLGRSVDVRDLELRVVVPVSLRTENERGVPSNRASAWLMNLPAGEEDPLIRHTLVRETTTRLKQARQELGPEVLGRAAEYAVPGMFTIGVRALARMNPYNLIVTNVPGPQVPLYLLGARLLGGYPQVPLFENQGLGIALFSYCGMLGVGFNADRELVPDVAAFAAAFTAAFAELEDACGLTPVTRASGAGAAR